MYDRYMYGRYMYEAPIVNGFSAFVKIKKTKKHMEDFSGYETQLRHQHMRRRIHVCQQRLFRI